MPSLGFAALLAGAILSVSGTARGEDYTWDGSTDFWDTEHWLPNNMPPPTFFPETIDSSANTGTINSGRVTFNRNDTFGVASIQASPVVSINSNATLASGGFFTTLWDLRLGGGTLLANGGVNPNFPAFQLAGTLSVTGTSASMIMAGEGTNNEINIGGNGNSLLTLDVADVTGNVGADLTITNGLRNSPYGGALGKTGTGTLVLTGASTFTGAVLVQAGLLEMNGGSITGSNQFDIGQDAATPANFTLNSGSLTLGSPTVGSQFVIGAHGSTGTAAINGGSLQIDGTIFVGGYTEGNGTGTITQTGGTVTTGRAVDFGGGGPNDGVYNLNGGTLTTPRVGRSGSGTSTFNFNGGTLKAVEDLHADAQPPGSNLGILQGLTEATIQSGGGTIDTNGLDVTIAQPLLNGGGNGTFVKNGAGTLTLPAAASNFTGDFTINAGTVIAAATSGGTTSALGEVDLARTITVNTGAVLQFSGNDVFGNDLVNPALTVQVNGGSLINGGNFFTTFGELGLNSGTITSVGGANSQFQAYQFKGTVTSNGQSFIDTTATPDAFNGFHLFGSTAFNVASGTLAVSAPLIEGNRGVAGLTKMGTGTMILSGENTYSGETAVLEGTLLVNGSISGTTTATDAGTIGGSGSIQSLSVLSGGSVAPGNGIGLLTANGDLTMNVGSTLKLELNTTTPATGYDQLAVNGFVELGSATLSLSGTYLRSGVNDVFFVLLNDEFDENGSTFNGLAEGSFVTAANGQAFRITYAADSSTSSFTGGNDIALMAVPEPGAAVTLLGGIGLLLGFRRRRL